MIIGSSLLYLALREAFMTNDGFGAGEGTAAVVEVDGVAIVEVAVAVVL